MKEAIVVIRPRECSESQERAFTHALCEGFPTADDELLSSRIRAAGRLAFLENERGAMDGIAALKSPAEEFRTNCFQDADAVAGASDYELELGWIYVPPSHRGRGIGERICRALLEHARSESLFATTAPDNRPMIRILREIGFVQQGRPFRRRDRDQRLLLFLRPSDGASGDFA